MIDDKKIEAAANKHIETEYARYNSGEVEEEMICLRGKDSFKAGAKWAIKEFIKDLWHPASEEPREFAEVLAEAKITESIKTYISFKRNDALFKNWDAYSSGANITRWLYIDDLFPKGGEQ